MADEVVNLEDWSDDRLVDLIRQAKVADERRAELLTSPVGIGSEMDALEKVIEAGTEGVSVLFHRYLYVLERIRRQYRIPRRGAGVRGLAGDDFAQDMFEKLRRSWAMATYNGEAPFERWYSTVLRHAYFDNQRAGRKEPPVVDPPLDERPPVPPIGDRRNEVEGDDSESRLRVALRGLPANYFASFLLAHLDAFTLGSDDLELIARESNRSLDDVIDCERDLYVRVLGPRRQRVKKLEENFEQAVAKLGEAQADLDLARAQLSVLERHSSVPRRSWLAIYQRIAGLRRRVAARIKSRERLKEQLADAVRVPSVEIARILRITPNTVDQRLSRAWKLLRERGSGD